MARRSAQERPSAAEAIEVCQEEETIGLQNAFSVAELSPSTAAAPRPGSGFMQISSDSRLVAVQGPVPGQPSCLQGATLLPEAFASPATHFRPIVLAANAGVARDTLALTSGPAERPEERRGRLDGEGVGKQAPEAQGAASGLKTPDQPAPGSPEPLRDSAQGCPSPPAPAPASPLEGASLVMPKSPAPAPPMTAQMPPPERGWKEPIPTAAACGGLEPRLPGPTAAPHSPCHPAKPPGGRATQVPGQEPEGPPSAPRSPSPAPGSPDGPGGVPVREWDDRTPEGHPKWPCPADHKLCPSSVDASPLSQETACPSLQEATRLIQEEFAFDGYLDHGLEALIMGTTGPRGPKDQGQARGGEPCAGGGHHRRAAHPPVSAQRAEPPGASRQRKPATPRPPPYSPPPPAPETRGTQKSTHVLTHPRGFFANSGEYIYALKDLTYATFCGAISEKFCDLYWGQRLLQDLFRVVNGRTSPSEK
ncbi:protein very KIND [Pontoporia blainvillei]|uniref:Protein very KIND n=1 Tax=Pontoporia blainvillei TaxID=48723 RepID=A0ABX0S280_PONBL|nr:protein very KIND [Pontoporia blainvillei]